MTWTQVECPFEKDKKIQSYLLTAPIYSEEGEAAPAWQQPLPHSTPPGLSLSRAVHTRGHHGGRPDLIPVLHREAQLTG